jgi:hypothetical protein
MKNSRGNEISAIFYKNNNSRKAPSAKDIIFCGYLRIDLRNLRENFYPADYADFHADLADAP